MFDAKVGCRKEPKMREWGVEEVPGAVMRGLAGWEVSDALHEVVKR